MGFDTVMLNCWARFVMMQIDVAGLWSTAGFVVLYCICLTVMLFYVHTCCCRILDCEMACCCRMLMLSRGYGLVHGVLSWSWPVCGYWFCNVEWLMVFGMNVWFMLCCFHAMPFCEVYCYGMLMFGLVMWSWNVNGYGY